MIAISYFSAAIRQFQFARQTFSIWFSDAKKSLLHCWEYHVYWFRRTIELCKSLSIFSFTQISKENTNKEKMGNHWKCLLDYSHERIGETRKQTYVIYLIMNILTDIRWTWVFSKNVGKAFSKEWKSILTFRNWVELTFSGQ